MTDFKRAFLEETLRKRKLFLQGPINLSSVELFAHAIIWLNAENDEDIRLYISSPGGDTGPGIDIYDLVRTSQAPIRGIVVGQASSMAAVVLQGCKQRTMMQNADITLHTIRVHRELAELLPENIERSLKGPLALQENIYEIFHKRTGKPIEEVKKAFAERWSFNAQKALGFGLVDEVL